MSNSQDFKIHEAANLFPLDEENIDELAVDIDGNGQQVPVELCDGKIIDGRRRFAACKRLGIDAKTRVVSPLDPIAYVMSLNLHRRHLTPSQRAMVAARARGLYDEQAKDRMKLSEGRGQKGAVKVPDVNRGDARDLAGKAASVSGTYVDRATKVLANAVPEVIQSVDEGRMSVTTAAVLSSEPPEVQRSEAAHPKRARTYNSVSAPVTSSINNEEENETNEDAPKVKGVGIVHANEAINCLTRIPKNDALRKRGFQLVTDWIRHNK